MPKNKRNHIKRHKNKNKKISKNSAVSQSIRLKIEIPVEVHWIENTYRIRDTIKDRTYIGFLRVRDLLNDYVANLKEAFNYFKITRMTLGLEKCGENLFHCFTSFTADQVQEAKSFDYVSTLDNAKMLPAVVGNKMFLSYRGLQYENPIGVPVDKFDSYPGSLLIAGRGTAPNPIVVALGNLVLYVKATGLK